MKRRIAYITDLKPSINGTVATGTGNSCPEVPALVIQLAQKGWEVDVFTPLMDLTKMRIRRLNSLIRVIQVKAKPISLISTTLDLKDMDRFYTEVRNFISEEKIVYHLIHADLYTSGLVALELKKKLNIPFVFTFREFEQLLGKPNPDDSLFLQRHKIEQSLVRRADVLIVSCPQEKANLIQFYKASAKKTFIVPSGFDPNQFFPIHKAEARGILKQDTGAQILLRVGNFVPQNGIDNLIKSLALMDSTNQNFLLILLEPDEDSQEANEACNERERLKLLAEDLGLASRISFESITQSNRFQLYYSAADLFVDTPVTGGPGKRLLEAMACGIPVIGSEVGAIQFTVIDGKTGFLVPPGNPDFLAERIKFIFKNRTLLEQMSRNSITHVQSSFTWKKVAEQTIDLYEYVLLIKTQTDLAKNQTAIKPVSRATPLRNAYLKRNMQAKYGN